tara:strand:- start:1900 stop:2766 length:867 start_codon:yes stop_codon:yes gene_type:complete
MISNFLGKITSFLNFKKNIYLIESNDDLNFLKEILTNESIIGLDTEFDWRNTYFPKLSLLQVATKNEILLIDCIKLKKLNFLKKILEDNTKTIIFHSSRSDTTVLNTNLNIKVTNVFDIQIAENIISGGDMKNYGAIVKKYFAKSLEQSQTNSNWLNRPFSNDQLAYAAEDVDFLIEIFKKQRNILKKLKKFDLAVQMSIEEAKKGNKELYVSRIKKLKKPSKIEKEIFMWREKFASKLNIPPSQVLKDSKLKILAKNINLKKFDKENFKPFFKDIFIAEDLFKNLNL